MTPRAIVAIWQRRLMLTALGAASMAAIAAALLSVSLATLLGAARAQGVALALVVAGCTVVLDLTRRLKGRLTVQRVALWLEEQAPSLNYALVAAVDGEAAPSPVLTNAVRAVDLDTPARRALWRAWRGPVLLLVVGGAVWTLQQSAAGPAVAGLLGRTDPTARSTALDAITIAVRPPAYAARATLRLQNPDILQPLVGSTITVEGGIPPTNAVPVEARLDSAALQVSTEGVRWQSEFAAPRRPSVLRLTHTNASRLIAIEPKLDSLPTATLESPARDTVLREPRGRFELRARAADDIGLVSAAFEYIISTGDGERFTFRTGTLGAQSPAGRSTAQLSALLDLEALTLKPGDVMHLRAVARDGNTVTGPGIGASDTRTIRVARVGEYDSVAVEPAPPPEEDKSLLSQRMLINLTEALVRRERSLRRDGVISESRRISRDQARLRKQVSDLVFSRLGDDASGEHFHGDGHDHADADPVKGPLTPEQLLAAAERATGGRGEPEAAHEDAPILSINRNLLAAYNAMWDAGRELDGGLPRRALPPMYAALAAIQKARAAERLYLRGIPPRVVIDLAKVRLQGKERGGDATRAPRPAVDPERRLAMERLQRAMALGDGAASADSLLLIRLSLVARWPAAATSFDALISDVRAGRDATANLLRVRRALDAATATRDALAIWGSVR